MEFFSNYFRFQIYLLFMGDEEIRGLFTKILEKLLNKVCT